MKPYLISLNATAQADKLKERKREKGIPAYRIVKFNYFGAFNFFDNIDIC